MSSRAPLCLIITVCSHFKSPLAMYLLHLRRCAMYNSEVWLVMSSCTYCTWCQPCDVFSDLCYFPWLVFRLHCITLHFIAFRLRSTLAFRLHCKTISSEVMLCCLLSSLGLQVPALGFLKLYLCYSFFVLSICVWNQITFESDLMSCWWLHFYGLVALIGCRQLWSVCCPETRGGVWSSA